MNSQEEKDRALRSQPQGSLESPFLQEELFVRKSEDEWEPRLVTLQSETPFQHAFEQGQPTLSEPEELEEEFVKDEKVPLQRPSGQLLPLPPDCQKLLDRKKLRVAVVGGGLAGLMAARRLVQHGIYVTVFEARSQVGGRVLSNHKFSKGRITEEGAELIGSFHTTWHALAREYGLAVISRMDESLYERAGLVLKLRLYGDLSRDLPMVEINQLGDAMTTVLEKIAREASKITHQSQPWLDPYTALKNYDSMSVADALKNLYNVTPNGQLWKALEFLLVNDEVAPLEEMNFLGLLCKVKGGQSGPKTAYDDEDDRLMGYWNKLEIFRCADGCQKLAEEMAKEIQTKGGKLLLRTAVTNIDMHTKGVILGANQVVDDRTGKLADRRPVFTHYDHVILAVPPSVWAHVTITADGKLTADGKKVTDGKKVNLDQEVGAVGMGPAVKFFSDVKERFWIKEKPPAAPSGGSSRLGMVWEGTDNQMRLDPKVAKQGIVLSVYAGPIIPIPIRPGGTSRRAPNRDEFKQELRRLYPDYTSNLTKEPLFSDWPNVPFIKTGFASPKLGQIFRIRDKLSEPFRGGRLFFAGEHTEMDFFGYMEGALRSGERAADTLIRQECGLLKSPAPAPPRPPVRTASAAPIRTKTASEYETESPLEEHSSTDYAGAAESSFLHQEFFVKRSEEEWKPRAAALGAESPFVGAIEERRSRFGEEQLEEEEAPDELEGEEEWEAEELWENMGEEQEEEESLDDEGAALREDETEPEATEDLAGLYSYIQEHELDQDKEYAELTVSEGLEADEDQLWAEDAPVSEKSAWGDEGVLRLEEADGDDEFADEFDETEEPDKFQDDSYETGEQGEELLAFEVPPLLKNPDKSGPRGKTLYVHISLGNYKYEHCVQWEKLTEEQKRNKVKARCLKTEFFGIPPTTGIFIPENYIPRSEVDIILYLHGHKSGIPGSNAPISGYWDGKKYPVFALREEVNASGKNVILVAPTLGFKSEAGDLVRGNGLDTYLEQVLEALRVYGPYKDHSPTIGTLILAAHSGGGKYMRLLATSDNRAAGKIRECWGFDSLYNRADVQPWRRWAKTDPQTRFLYSYYRPGLPKTNSERLEKDSRGRVDKLPNIRPIPSQERDHFKLVRLYLRERLAGAAFLRSIAADSRQGSEQLFDEAEDDEYFSDHEFEGEEEMLAEDALDLEEAPLILEEAWIEPEEEVGAYPLTEWKLASGKIVIASTGDKKKGTYVAITEAPAVFLPEILGAARDRAKKDKKNDLADQLDPATWFKKFTRITFLGRPLKSGQYLHLEMAKLLKAIENEMVKKYGGDAKSVGDMLLNKSTEGISGSRLVSSTATFSMHMFGLAVDVNYLGNPFIESKEDIKALNRVLKNAALLMNKPTLSYQKGYAKNKFDSVQQLDAMLEKYFSLLDKPAELEQLAQASLSSEWRGLSVVDAKLKIQKNLDNLAGLLARGGKKKDYFKQHAILDFDKRFIEQMEELGLHWGGHYGDMMHFDMRTIGVGLYIEKARLAYAKQVKDLAQRLFKEKKFGTHSPDKVGV